MAELKPMEPTDRADVEDRIRRELAEAFDAFDHSSAAEKPEASSRLNRAVRRLFDFVIRRSDSRVSEDQVHRTR